MACPYCDRRDDRLLTRAAVLARCLRRTAVWAHAQLRHEGEDWTRCQQEPCRPLRRALLYDDVE